MHMRTIWPTLIDVFYSEDFYEPGNMENAIVSPKNTHCAIDTPKVKRGSPKHFVNRTRVLLMITPRVNNLEPIIGFMGVSLDQPRSVPEPSEYSSNHSSSEFIEDTPEGNGDKKEKEDEDVTVSSPLAAYKITEGEKTPEYSSNDNRSLGLHGPMKYFIGKIYSPVCGPTT